LPAPLIFEKFVCKLKLVTFVVSGHQSFSDSAKFWDPNVILKAPMFLFFTLLYLRLDNIHNQKLYAGKFPALDAWLDYNHPTIVWR